MYFYRERLINEIVPDRPDPEAAKVFQEILGGRFGEMRTMLQYSFQGANFRGPATQFRDLIKGIFLEEIAHVELVQHTINALLNQSGDSPTQQGEMAALREAAEDANPHQYIIGAQSSVPEDAAHNPFLGTYVYSHGNLVSDLLDNLVLESTGVIQKTRIYEMSHNKTLRETLAFLIVRDNAHQNAFAKALETLGVNWGKLLPIPTYDITRLPECRKYLDMGYNNIQFNFRLDDTRIGEIFQGTSPSKDGGELRMVEPPAGFPVPELPELPIHYAPDPQVRARTNI
ncbi:manganese catalase family protein [Paenibacillus xerothermodurans]|uniref:Manganese catalase family protein n=1 Tax=Paenibacillus xerothermodurans TaxID=1977292 RepID=A0A2W1NWQ5_PAEXE|nr:manganese catalase family protein [Paenibacillus xerothermodurans]PZE22146.1 manganese catalase family protein [Paenibacillus xerothermodurans]